MFQSIPRKNFAGSQKFNDISGMQPWHLVLTSICFSK